jgi:uncharacterized protein (DUF58 family)
MGASMRRFPTIARLAPALVHPFETLRQLIDAWIFARVKRVPSPAHIHRRRVYILPTRYGYGYALLVLTMWLGAMNYSNSMAFALTFLLAGLGLVALHHTHANLVNLEVRGTRALPTFAGQTATFVIELVNPARAGRYALVAAWNDRTAPPSAIDVPPGGSAALTLHLPAIRRGWLPAPRFCVFTEFPLGLFHAWTWVELELDCLVYPRPAPAGTQPPAAPGGRGARTGTRSGDEEFVGLRAYQRGDAPRSIHWKSLPKNVMPQVKQFAETLERELWLDWNGLPQGWDVERRLSQLARWVLDAQAAGSRYGLRLPGWQRAPARGALHRHECLKALALFTSSP